MDATGRDTDDRLSAYRAKRSIGVTPEPAGALGAGDGHLFVVHKHAASHLHWDLRLQMEGVLRSWAVPKGPSANPDDKRLAVLVEDHPLEYADFEGLIPEGNYGAGAVIVWDRGEWVPIEDPVAGLAKGKLLFDLRGYKLRGRWTLVKIKKGEREWLLIKERDALVREDGGAFPEQSVLSGLTVEELREGTDRAGEVRERLRALGAPERAVAADARQLMLAEPRARAFDRDGWVFEIKYDGYRMLATAGPEPQLLSRSGHDFTASFPELARALRALPYDHVVFDGEIVVHDAAGLPSFQRLQKRGRLTRAPDVRRAAVELPAVLYVFDLLGFEGWDLRDLPLTERKGLARKLLPPVGPLRYADHVERTGVAFYEQAVRLGLEGVVAKRADAPYRPGRSSLWLKVRADRTDDFVVAGFSAPKGARAGFGALHVAWYDGDALVYAGRVGTGFRDEDLVAVRDTLEGLVQDAPPCANAPTGPEHRWVSPTIVAEVRYKEVTDDGLLRQPVFVRFRDDKPPQDCLRRGGNVETEGEAAPVVRPGRVEVLLSNLDKVFWPAERYTKGDLIEFYRTAAPWMLPYLQDRPLVMTRFPDGIEGKSFFQKDAPVFAPEWVRTEVIYSDDAEREVRYFVADDADALAYVANLGTIPIHVWASRIATLEQPDWAIIDLDPKEAPFAHVVTLALAARRLCETIGLPCFVKTSGSTGLHLLLPLGRRCTHDQARQLAELLALVLVAQHPEIATVRRLPSQRDGRVYLDYLQNGRGKLLVAPFSVRPLPGAPVSTPLVWDEVGADLDIRRFTIRTVPDRLRRLGDDPLRGVLDVRPDLGQVLGRLQGGLAP